MDNAKEVVKTVKAPKPQTAPKQRKGKSLERQKAKMGWLFVAPFLIGFVLNESGPTARRPFGAWFHLRHAAAFFACQLAGELVFGVYRYFQTASVDSGVVPHALARCAIFAAAAMLLYPALRRLFAGKKPQPAQATYRKIREVKHF